MRVLSIPLLCQALSRVTVDFPGSDVIGITYNYEYDNTGRVVSIAPLSFLEDQQSSSATELQYDGDFLISIDSRRETSNYTIEMDRIVSRATTNEISNESRTTRYTYDESERLVQVN